MKSNRPKRGIVPNLEAADNSHYIDLTRQERDALRIHAEQIMGVITSKDKSGLNLKTRTGLKAYYLLLSDLKETSLKISRDYAENDNRAFDKKQYERWQKIARAADEQLKALAQHNMQLENSAHLLADITNLTYVLAMNVAGIANNMATIISAGSASATAISSGALAMVSNQPYIGIALFSAQIVLDTAYISTHNYERNVDGWKKKEAANTKFLENARWMQLVNSFIWLTASVFSLIFISNPVIMMVAMTGAILITGFIRVMHQVVEVNKLKAVRQLYRDQLKNPSLSPRRKQSLKLLHTQITQKITMAQQKIFNSTILTAVSVTGLIITLVGFLACTPLMLLGSLMLFAGLVAIIVTNRKAIGAAVKSIHNAIHKPKNASTPAKKADAAKVPTPKEQINSHKNSVKRQNQTRSGLKGMVHVHRNSQGNNAPNKLQKREQQRRKNVKSSDAFDFDYEL